MKNFTLRSLQTLFVTFSTLMTGCVAHLNQQQCMTMNWYQEGVKDASQGSNKRDLNGAIKDCAKFQLTVDTAKYDQGFRAGARQFCQPDTAYNLGVRGQGFNNICPSDLAGAFNSAWRRGLRKYCTPDTGYNLGRNGNPMPNFCAPDQLPAFSNAYQSGARIYSNISSTQSSISNVNNQINDLQKQLSDKENDINSKQSDIDRIRATATPGDFSQDQINRNMSDIFNLRREVSQLRLQITNLQEQKTALEERLSGLEAE